MIDESIWRIVFQDKKMAPQSLPVKKGLQFPIYSPGPNPAVKVTENWDLL